MACLLTAWWCWLYSTYLSNHLHLMFKRWFCKKFLFCHVHYRSKIYYQVAQCEGISIVLCTLWMEQGELCTNKPRKKYIVINIDLFFGIRQINNECSGTSYYFQTHPASVFFSYFTRYCLTKWSSYQNLLVPKLWCFCLVYMSK